MIVGAVHGEVVVDFEAGRGDGLHSFGLVEDVFEGREVVFEPGVAGLGVALYCLGHVLGVRRHSPGANRDPGALLLAEELVDRYSGGLAHQIVHRCAQGQRGLVADPCKGVGAEVAVDCFLCFGRAAAFAEAAKAIVGMRDIDGAACRAVVVVERVGDPVVVFGRDFVDFDVDDLHGFAPLSQDRHRAGRAETIGGGLR